MIRTLVVDDHPAIRHGLVAILGSEPGIEAIGAAATSAEALEQTAREHPDCVLVDLELGKENGLELITRLRSLPEPPGVVLYSAFSEPAVALAAEAAGAGASVGKGAPIDEVIAAIRSVVY